MICKSHTTCKAATHRLGCPSALGLPLNVSGGRSADEAAIHIAVHAARALRDARAHRRGRG